MAGYSLEQVLMLRRDAIVARFIAEVRRKDLPPQGLRRPQLVDHIPNFLDEILLELRSEESGRTSFDAFDRSPTAQRHGEQRWRLGYDIEALLREYGILRHCILEEAKQADVRISIDEFDILAKCLNVGATEAAAVYVRRRDEEWTFLADAGELLSSSLDRMSILARLTRLAVPRFADWCTVYVAGVDDAPVAHVDPLKVPSLRELQRRWASSAASGGAYFLALETGQPEVVQEASPEALRTLAPIGDDDPLLRDVGLRSWTILPLRVKDEPLAVMVLAYGESDKHYSPSDLPVLQELAAKAAVSLENAHLYGLSQQARTRVEAAIRAKDEFVAMVSHELRTPLNSILGWLRLQRSGVLSQQKRAHAFDVIERNAKALNGLVADLLDVSRILTGNIRLNLSVVDFPTIVELAVDGVRPSLDAKQIGLVLNVGHASELIRADEERLQQVVWNLLSNAIKFTPKNGRIEVSVRHVDSQLELEVKDTGSGISAEFLPHVFDSFRQWESGSTRRHGGLGIGLSIARHIVELHGGSITASSEGLQQGSTFTVRLPLAHLSPRENARVVPVAKSPSLALQRGLEGLRVLVIDDEEDARELLRVLLQASGIEVRVADSSESGVIALQEFAPDVVVSDIAMPSDDGYTLIRRIRTLASKAAETPVIALTAYVRSEDRNRALVEGFNAHLGKPVEPEELLRAIADLAGRPHARRRE